jgi:hypothetical protein
VALKVGELVGFLRIDRAQWTRGIEIAKRQLASVGDHVAAVGRTNGLALLAAQGLHAAAAIAPVSGVLLAIPAAASVAVVALTAVKVGTAGVGDAMKAAASGDAAKLNEALQRLSPSARAFVRAWSGVRGQFAPIQQAVQQRLFLNLDRDVAGLAKTTLPALRAGLVPTAGALNGLAREGIQAGSSPMFSGMVARAGQLAASVLQNLHGVANLLVATLANALKVGSPWVDKLAQMAGAGLKVRLAFLGSEAGAAAMNDTINRGMSTAGRLSSILGNLGRTLSAVLGAAGITVGARDLLATVDQLTARMADWARSAAGQAAIGDVFAHLADVGGRVVDVLGQVLGAAGQLNGLMGSLPGGVQSLATDFVAWSIVLGPISGRLVSIGTAALTMIGGLGRAAAAVYRFAFVTTTAAGTTRAAWLAAKLSVVGSWIAMAATATASAARTAAVATASAIRAAAVWVASHATMLASTVATAAAVVAAWVLMGVQSLVQAARMAAAWVIAMGPVGWVIAAIVGLVALVIANWDTVKRVTAVAWDWIWSHAIRPVIDAIMGYIHWWVGNVLAVVGLLGALPGRVGGWFGQAKDAIVSRLAEAIAWVSGVPGRVLGALGNVGNLLYDAGRSIIQGLINGIRDMAGRAVSAVSDVARSVRDHLPFSPAKRGPFAGRGYTLYSGRAMIRDWARGITSQRGAAVDAITRVMTAAAGQGAGLPGWAAPGGTGTGTGTGTGGSSSSSAASGSSTSRLVLDGRGLSGLDAAVWAWLRDRIRFDAGGDVQVALGRRR